MPSGKKFTAEQIIGKPQMQVEWVKVLRADEEVGVSNQRNVYCARLVQAGVWFRIVVEIQGVVPFAKAFRRVEAPPGRIDTERVGHFERRSVWAEDSFLHDAVFALKDRQLIAADGDHALAIEQAGTFRTVVDVNHGTPRSGARLRSVSIQL